MTQRQAPSEARYAALQSKISRLSTGTAPIPERRTSTVEYATASTTSDRTTHAVPVTTSCNRVEVRVGLGISKPMLNQRMKDPDHEDRNGQMAMIHVVTASSPARGCGWILLRGWTKDALNLAKSGCKVAVNSR